MTSFAMRDGTGLRVLQAVKKDSRDRRRAPRNEATALERWSQQTA